MHRNILAAAMIAALMLSGSGEADPAGTHSPLTAPTDAPAGASGRAAGGSEKPSQSPLATAPPEGEPRGLCEPRHLASREGEPCETGGAEEEAACWTEEDAALIARVIWAEARGLPEPEQAAVAWCILNRVDESGGTIAGTAAAPGQFVIGELHEAQLAIARDVLARWEREKAGETDVGRTLPPGYLWFTGDGRHNWFRDAYEGGHVWGW